mgnify:CR=1 FL=1
MNRTYLNQKLGFTHSFLQTQPILPAADDALEQFWLPKFGDPLLGNILIAIKQGCQTSSDGSSGVCVYRVFEIAHDEV